MCGDENAEWQLDRAESRGEPARTRDQKDVPVERQYVYFLVLIFRLEAL